ncbi:MAG: S8 family serine peptidase, partial [Halobacteriovoraceae bacterium]|nr:S8 family serine peptidase [Halobacteriovoraceae bacterium]
MNLLKTNTHSISTLLLATVLIATGCSGKSSKLLGLGKKPLDLISGDLFSDRPTNLTNVAILIKLKTPSLIESSSKAENGQLVISEAVKKQLIQEQDETLKKVKEISPEIKLLFSYKFSVNALALSVPAELYEQVGTLGTVADISRETIFKRPETPAVSQTMLNALINKANEFKTTSVSHIGANQVHNEMGIRGKGIKVGVIDTGIDFTHTMMGGTGNTADYENMDKEKETPLFPNQKVVGGYDFAGTDYSPGAVFPDWRVPRPDVNPVDEGGQGTHVAGSVAGIGDGTNTYDGVAPDADLYALKVFGNNGGTSDTVVIAAMEWAMDPNGDMDPSDRLDVLNLSLGGSYGKPYILYSLAIQNLAKAGVFTTISAGNSGPTPYI